MLRAHLTGQQRRAARARTPGDGDGEIRARSVPGTGKRLTGETERE